MPRRLRLQFPGAIQHVYNRGNYRQPIFATAGAARAFEACLFEAAERFDWLLHAYAIQLNHYHQVVETPRANLSAGMHWLLSTYAIRFNLRRDERGHVFQGRYHSKLVEPGGYLVALVNYIHLNPVEAGIVPVERAADFRWGSLRRFVRGDRPPCLVCADWLEEIGGLKDTPDGWRSYQAYLVWLMTEEGERKRQAAEIMTHRWALGSKGWRSAVAKEQAQQRAEADFRRGEIGELKEASWSRVLMGLLVQAGKTPTDLRNDRCGAPWKVALADQLRRQTTATNTWIAAELQMGSRNSVSVYLSRLRRGN